MQCQAILHYRKNYCTPEQIKLNVHAHKSITMVTASSPRDNTCSVVPASGRATLVPVATTQLIFTTVIPMANDNVILGKDE